MVNAFVYNLDCSSGSHGGLGITQHSFKPKSYSSDNYPVNTTLRCFLYTQAVSV